MSDQTFYVRLAEVAAATPDASFQVHGERSWTWAEALRDVDALAAGLLRLGVRRGDKVAIWLPNVPEWPLIWLAAASLGAAAVPVNTRYKADEAAFVAGQSDSVVLFHLPEFLGNDYTTLAKQVVADERTSLRQTIAVGTPVYDELLTGPVDSDALAAARAAVEDTDDVILVYTSGTTGFPKGARHRHTTLSDVATMAELMGVRADDRILAALPFFHVGGSFLAIATALVTGCSISCLEHFTGENALRCIERDRATVINGVPSHFVMMLSEIERTGADTSSARVGFIAGAMIPPEVVRGIRQLLEMDLITMYGMTETTGVISSTRIDDPDEVLLATVGRVIADDYEFGVFDVDTLQPAEVGAQGEVWVRGHRVTPGYYKIDDAETFRPDGWFRTGDLGAMRADGNLVLTGRRGDMFIVGGTNTYPAEIENVIGRLDEIAQVHVVGIPEERLGEVGMAFVQLKEGSTLTAEDVINHCKANLANYKVPRRVEFTDGFPMTATGKIQKYRLRDRVIEELGLAELADRRLLDYRRGTEGSK